MNISTLWFAVAILHLIGLGLAIPALSTIRSSPVPRSQHCANAPGTIAGTTLNRRLLPRGALPDLPSGSAFAPITWCARQSRTYVILTLSRPLSRQIVLSLLDDAYSNILGHKAMWGDGVVEGGLFQWAGAERLMLRIVNANNHQLTWGVLGAAIDALGEYMNQAVTGPGESWFSIFDGRNEVGTGTITEG